MASQYKLFAFLIPYIEAKNGEFATRTERTYDTVESGKARRFTLRNVLLRRAT